MINPFQFLRSTQLTFVKKQHESGDIETFYFSPDKPIHHTAGQHGLFILPRFKGLHIFSLASAPSEEHILVGTHVRAESEYKQRLASMQPGDRLTMVGPVLNFTLPKNTHPVVFLAQGIGITPFRSMLIQNARNIQTTLIHVDSNEHTYRHVTQPLATTAHYVQSPEVFTEALVTTIASSTPSTIYYLSGSPRFVAATKQTLRAHNVTKQQMKTDTFIGY